jgi:integrase
VVPQSLERAASWSFPPHIRLETNVSKDPEAGPRPGYRPAGTGGKGRRVRFSAGAGAAIDRYLARRQAGWPRADGPLWISRVGPLGYAGAVDTLKRRAADAGVKGFHIHRLRHTAAVRWLRSGGTETGLRAHAEWTSNTMVALRQDRVRADRRR